MNGFWFTNVEAVLLSVLWLVVVGVFCYGGYLRGVLAERTRRSPRKCHLGSFHRWSHWTRGQNGTRDGYYYPPMSVYEERKCKRCGCLQQRKVQVVSR